MAATGNTPGSPSPLATPGGVGEPLPVPKVFHFVWFGELPLNLADYTDTWSKHHPDWEVKRWDYHNLPQLRNQDLFDRAGEITGGDGFYQFMSDIVRLEILESEGGVYVDCDFECLRSIDCLVRVAKSAFAAWEVNNTWLNNAFLGAAPHHPMITKCIEELPESVERRQPRTRPNVYSGPQYFTPIALAHAETTTFFPQSWFYPYAWNELHRSNENFDGAFAVHHWNNQRRKHGLVEA